MPVATAGRGHDLFLILVSIVYYLAQKRDSSEDYL